MTKRNTKGILPWFTNSFSFGKSGAVVPFYVENGVAKSGHYVSESWIEDTLSPDQLAHMPQKRFPLNGVSVYPIDRTSPPDHAHLIFLEKVNKGTTAKTLTFWEALIFLSSGNFLGKYHFLKKNTTSSLLGENLDTLHHLRAFFSCATTFGEDACNMLFDVDRKVIVVRGTVGDDVLGKDVSYPDAPKNYANLRGVIISLLK